MLSSFSTGERAFGDGDQIFLDIAAQYTLRRACLAIEISPADHAHFVWGSSKGRARRKCHPV